MAGTIQTRGAARWWPRLRVGSQPWTCSSKPRSRTSSSLSLQHPFFCRHVGVSFCGVTAGRGSAAIRDDGGAIARRSAGRAEQSAAKHRQVVVT
eukprot:2609896-Rhodomonas_salina.1